VLDGKQIKYFIGDYIYTNRIDTLEYGNERNSPIQFSQRNKHSFTIHIGGSDPLTVDYYDRSGYFDFFRTP
ncbi:MAG TPA: hypothetical protein VGQ59_21065, partial [Cyclobacteriaceae bacterium]|nr:hypothetical protein [Cyclobacteriaceae bacterium]